MWSQRMKSNAANKQQKINYHSLPADFHDSLTEIISTQNTPPSIL